MKTKVTNYTFDKTAKTVTFTDYGTILLDSILLITNVTRNIIIYNFADPTKGGTVATNVLTLTYDTSAQANTDKLLIYYDDATAKQLVTPDLPTGAATGAKQDTGNTSLSSIDGKITAVNTGAVVISSSALPSLAATSTKQSDGSQKTQIVDGSGNVIGATTNALDINIKSGNPTSITANAGTNLNTSALALESGGNLATVSALSRAEDAAHSSGHTGVMALAVREATATDLSAGATDGDYEPLQVDANGRLHVNVGNTVTVGSHAVTNAGTFAVQATEADGANTTLGAKADAKSTATDTTAVSVMSVLKQISASVQAPPSQAVTNAGTFAVQATLAAETTKVIGTVNQGTSPWVANISQINGVTPLMGAGNTGTGSQRVTIASDQAVIPVSDNSGSFTVDAPVGTPVFTTPTPSTTGGWSKIKYAAQTTTVQTPKGTAGTFGGYFIYNPNSSVAYLQVFDAATATSITLGTTVPDMIFGIPASSGANLEIGNGVNMANGIKLACTTTATGLTAPSTGLDMTIFYK